MKPPSATRIINVMLDNFFGLVLFFLAILSFASKPSPELDRFVNQMTLAGVGVLLMNVRLPDDT
jgi:hypothetical protein